jgi:hypothetical protein
MPYLNYDIKGIQRFIFSVPRLKCIVGASSLIDEFDQQAKSVDPVAYIFSGGGKGSFGCRDLSQLEDLKQGLIKLAHDKGLDIQFGMAETLSEAARGADQFYPFCPPSLEGEPCALSGLLPTTGGKVHPMIQRRMKVAKSDAFGKGLLKDLQESLPAELRGKTIEFFRNVSPEIDPFEYAEDQQLETRHALAAESALGYRNRWAVIAMDGNDMGIQFGAYQKLATDPNGNLDQDRFRNWIAIMSQELRNGTRKAALAGIQAVISSWVQDEGDAIDESTYVDDQDQEVTVLPLRPLIIGGDDIVILCHARYAFEFVIKTATVFAHESRLAAERHRSEQLWPGSNNQLSISAGVLFSNVSLPLHSAIHYAEALLKNAKKTYRLFGKSNGQSTGPTPAAVDFEAVTDSLLDTPTERRRRELLFTDPEIGQQICLTMRPYRLFDDPLPEQGSDSDTPPVTWEYLNDLADQLAELPTSVRSGLLPAMRRSWSERTEYFASMLKRYPKIVKLFSEGLIEPDKIGPGWFCSKQSARKCSIADALILLEEERRSRQMTV